ncbi:MAG: hypothetical protein HRU70_07120 [Phycisphaeraceae bacterium]|nr:MAG: hypothetical protein HRU70_07120 [Phycisphaeraceae bacterium]
MSEYTARGDYRSAHAAGADHVARTARCVYVDLKRWIRTGRGTRVAIFFLSLLMVFGASITMMRLSGSALWVPSEWRTLVGIIGPTIGMSTFGLVRLLFPATPGVLNYVVAGVAGAGTLAFVSLYMSLCSVCVRNVQFDPSFWEEFIIRSSAGPAFAGRPSGLIAGGGLTPAAGPILREVYPPFLDSHRSQIYLPIEWGRGARSYFVLLGRHEMLRGGDPRVGDESAALEFGLSWSLQHEPMRVVEFLQGESAPALASTTWRILMTHLAVLLCWSVLLGALATPLGALIGQAASTSAG